MMVEDRRRSTGLIERAEHLEAINAVTRAVLRGDAPHAIARHVLSQLRILLNCEFGSVVLFDFENGMASLLAVDSERDARIRDGLTIPVSELCGDAFLTPDSVRGLMAVSSLQDDTSALVPCMLKEEGFQSLVKASLEFEGEVLGLLVLGRRGDRAFTAHEQAIIREAADVLCIGLQKAFLREELRSYQELFNGIPVGLFRIDQKGTVVHANPAFARILGFETVEEVKGTEIDRYFVDRENFNRWMRQLLEKGTVEGFEVQLRKTSGETIWVRGNARLFKKGKDTFAEGHFSDITSVKRAEVEKERIQRELFQAHKLELLGRMVGGIVHDFSNVITVIRGFTDILALKLPADSSHKTAIKHISAAVERATALTRKLLAFSRRQNLDMSAVSVNDLLESMEVLLKRALGEQVTLTMRLNPTRPVWGDPVQIEQVVMNLVINARDAMPEGGEVVITTDEVMIESEVAERKDIEPGIFVCISVSDTGIGMDGDVLQQIFDPFFTTKEEGTGLGLSVVYGIVKQHNGFIDVRSTPVEGTTFKVFFPACQGEKSSF